MNRWMKWLGTGMLLLLLVVSAAPVTAATLSGGSYTYVVNGQEVNFAFDPVALKDGLLLPLEVFEHFGITAEASGRSLVLKRHSTTARLTLGSLAYDLSGAAAMLPAVPLQLNGRHFVPADLLRPFGVEFSHEGSLLIMDDLAVGMPEVVSYQPEEMRLLRQGRIFSAVVRADNGSYMQGEFTWLSPELTGASQLELDTWDRARLQRLLKTNTLILVKLSNTSSKAGQFNAAGAYLLGSSRTQYDLVRTLDLGSVSITSKLVPGAERHGVLVFPKVDEGTRQLSLYYDPNGSTLGTFTQAE